jgi:hypothetical protein
VTQGQPAVLSTPFDTFETIRSVGRTEYLCTGDRSERVRWIKRSYGSETAGRRNQARGCPAWGFRRLQCRSEACRALVPRGRSSQGTKDSRPPNEIQNDERVPAGPSHTASDKQKRTLNKRRALKELSDGALKIDRSIWPLPSGDSPRALDHNLHLTSVQQVATGNLPRQAGR